MLRGAIAMAAPNVRASFQAGKGANPPLVVLVHGLESFSGTWDAVRARCASPDGVTPFLFSDLWRRMGGKGGGAEALSECFVGHFSCLQLE